MNALGAIGSIRVASRTSAFRASAEGKDVAEIARALSVSHLLEGSVRTAGSRLRVTAQLTDVASGFQLWSERFDREAGDVFAVQDEIAGRRRRGRQGEARAWAACHRPEAAAQESGSLSALPPWPAPPVHEERCWQRRAEFRAGDRDRSRARPLVGGPGGGEGARRVLPAAARARGAPPGQRRAGDGGPAAGRNRHRALRRGDDRVRGTRLAGRRAPAPARARDSSRITCRPCAGSRCCSACSAGPTTRRPRCSWRGTSIRCRRVRWR